VLLQLANPAIIEGTPILGPLQNSTPQAIGKGSCASIRASIDAVALEADSGMMTMMAMTTLSLASQLTLIPRIYLQGI
jgi:hypothetical protein